MYNTGRYLIVVMAALVAPVRTVAASCVPGFNYAAFGKNSLTFSGNGHTDSYDSAVGSTTTASGGDVCTDGTQSGAATFSGNGTISGNTCVGAGGNPATAITISGSATTQTTSVQGTNTTLPSVTIPIVGTNQGDQSVSGGQGTLTLAPNQTYGNVSCSGLSLTLNAGTYVMSSLVLTANCQLIVGSGPITLYITTNLDITGGGIANSTLVSSNLMIFCGPNVANVALTGGALASFGLYAPDSNVSISGNGDIFGAVVGKTVTDSGDGAIHYDRELAGAAGGGFVCPPVEVSRSSPILAAINAQDAIVQGSYETPFPVKTQVTLATDVPNFVFPYTKGHLRARTAASIQTYGSTYSTATVLFDAADMIPTVNMAGCGANQFKGTCRTVFTTTTTSGTGTTRNPPLVYVQDSNADAIGGLIAPTLAHAQWLTLTERVLAGAPDGSGGFIPRLGGVDRSSVAVIGTSQYAGGARPTIVYFGATDGMLHAVCGSIDSAHGCDALGRELWAFLPRVQLPRVAMNSTRIDGSPRVTDMFGDFTNSGTRSFHTILTFQTGSGSFTVSGKTPAVYALDITDPQHPTVVWEYTLVGTGTGAPTRGTFELGNGETLAAGSMVRNPVSEPVVYAETNNGGTGGAGVVLTAINAETGAQVFKVGYLYPAPRANGDVPVPASGIPGGAVGIDKAGQGYITDVVFADLYGNLWEVDPATGASRTGAAALTTPLFSFSTDYHAIGAAPAIYSNGSTLFAVLVSGGYADMSDTTWGSASQYVVSVRLTPSGVVPPFNQASGPPNVPVSISLGAGEKAYAQATIVGTQLFLTTDTSDVNAVGYASTLGTNTGHSYSFDMAAGSQGSMVLLANGASSIINDGTILYASSGSEQQRLATGAISTVGPKTDSQSIAHMARQLWLRTQ